MNDYEGITTHPARTPETAVKSVTDIPGMRPVPEIDIRSSITHLLDSPLNTQRVFDFEDTHDDAIKVIVDCIQEIDPRLSVQIDERDEEDEYIFKGNQMLRHFVGCGLNPSIFAKITRMHVSLEGKPVCVFVLLKKFRMTQHAPALTQFRASDVATFVGQARYERKDVADRIGTRIQEMEKNLGTLESIMDVVHEQVDGMM